VGGPEPGADDPRAVRARDGDGPRAARARGQDPRMTSMRILEGALVPLGRWIATTRSVPPGARRAAALQVADLVAAAHASARQPATAAMLSAIPMGTG